MTSVMPEIRTQLRDAVFAAIDELNAQRPPDQRLPKALDTALTGEHGPLDSLAFVNLIVALEQRLDAMFGTTMSLLDDERLDPTAGQFRTVQALIDYLETIRVRPANG
jgi:acyl carrier protein